MGRKTSLITTVISYIISILFFASINPSSLPVGMLLAPFIVIFFVLYMTLYSSVLLFSDKVSSTQIKLITTLVSTACLLLLIQSVTQLTIRDIVISLLIVTILIWYLSKTSKKSEV